MIKYEKKAYFVEILILQYKLLNTINCILFRFFNGCNFGLESQIFKLQSALES